MRRYANRYIEADRLTGFLADPRRVVVGAIIAPAVGALATEVPTFTFVFTDMTLSLETQLKRPGTLVRLDNVSMPSGMHRG